MATLTGATVASTYGLLLKVDATGIDASTPRTIQDGDANNTALKLAGSAVQIKQSDDSSATLEVTGASTLTGAVTATGGVTGALTGNVTGNVTGNLAGDVTGDVTGGVTGNVTGNLTGNVTGDITGNVTATSVLADGVTATTQAFSDSSTKVATTAFVEASVPTGAMAMWYTASAPTGWLFCDGTTFDAGTYPDLNTLLGGNTLPDLKGRMPIGVGQGSTAEGGGTGTDRALAATGGAETHTLTGGESGTSAHGHWQGDLGEYTFKIAGTDTRGATSSPASYRGAHAGGATLQHKTEDTAEADADDAHQNMSPFLAVNFIIKT